MNFNNFDFNTLYKSETYTRGEFEVTLKELSVQQMRAVEIERKKDEYTGTILGIEYATDGLITEEIFNKLPNSIQMELSQIWLRLNLPADALEKIAKNLPSPTV